MFGFETFVTATISAIPVIIGTGALVCGALKMMNILPTYQPELVIVRAPYGYPEDRVRDEMRLHAIHDQFPQGKLHYMKYPITDQSNLERAMIEMSKRMSFWRRYFSTDWFVIHAPNIDNVAILETLAITHGYRVNIMDVPIPMNDGFPKQEYYDWANQNTYVRNKEDEIQSYFTSWQSWTNTGIKTLGDSEDPPVSSSTSEKED